jgi:hypothetical protein
MMTPGSFSEGSSYKHLFQKLIDMVKKKKKIKKRRKISEASTTLASIDAKTGY